MHSCFWTDERGAAGAHQNQPESHSSSLLFCISSTSQIAGAAGPVSDGDSAFIQQMQVDDFRAILTTFIVSAVNWCAVQTLLIAALLSSDQGHAVLTVLLAALRVGSSCVTLSSSVYCLSFLHFDLSPCWVCNSSNAS